MPLQWVQTPGESNHSLWRYKMSKTNKDGKLEREKRGPIPLRDKKRPPQKEKGGHKSIRELVEDEG